MESDDPRTTVDRLAMLARTDPVASAVLSMHKGGIPLDECLIIAAEHWSRRCREADLAALDAAVKAPPQPIVLVMPEADIERLKARLKATT